MEQMLQVTNVKKVFHLSRKQQAIEKTKIKEKKALKGVSFEVGKGEVYGLLGPNGAGKTTMLRIMATLIAPEDGEVKVQGFSVVKEPEEVRRRIGFLTSELKLEDFFTPNYLFDFFGELHGVEKEICSRRKEELFARFGIDQFAEVKVGNLSTGMKQKVSLVVSLAHDPEIIIFDEPTNGLDIITAKVVTDFLMELKSRGKTIIISTHIFSLIEKICDRVGIIMDGRMICSDALENMTAEKSLEDVFFTYYENLEMQEGQFNEA